MKDRSKEPRSYNGGLMHTGEPGEAYIGAYLAREYDRVLPVGKEKRRRDYRCFKQGAVHLNEGKTDTRIAETHRVPWEAFRLEERGQRAYTAWGWERDTFRVLFFVPQWMQVLDVTAQDMRRVIFENSMNPNSLYQIPLLHTLTDQDRITYFFAVPIGLLEEAGALRRVRIAELPLGPAIAHQKPLL